MAFGLVLGALGLGASVASGLSGDRQRRSGARRQTTARIIQNNIRARATIRAALQGQGAFTAGFTARGAEQGSSAFQAGRGSIRGQVASEVRLNERTAEFEAGAARNFANASRMQALSNTFGAISSFGFRFNSVFGGQGPAQPSVPARPPGFGQGLGVLAPENNPFITQSPFTRGG